MDAENLKKATGLNSEIEALKKQIDTLQQAERINDNLDLNYGYLRKEYIDFNLLKTITLFQMREKIRKFRNRIQKHLKNNFRLGGY